MYTLKCFLYSRETENKKRQNIFDIQRGEYFINELMELFTQPIQFKPTHFQMLAKEKTLEVKMMKPEKSNYNKIKEETR